MNFDQYKQKYPLRQPRYADKPWWSLYLGFLNLDWSNLFRLEYSRSTFSLLFNVWKVQRFANVVFVRDELQGDAVWFVVLSFFWLAFKFEVGIPDLYRFERPSPEWYIDFDLLEKFEYPRIIHGAGTFEEREKEKKIV